MARHFEQLFRIILAHCHIFFNTQLDVTRCIMGEVSSEGWFLIFRSLRFSTKYYWKIIWNWKKKLKKRWRMKLRMLLLKWFKPILWGVLLCRHVFFLAKSSQQFAIFCSFHTHLVFFFVFRSNDGLEGFFEFQILTIHIFFLLFSQYIEFMLF